MALPSAVPITNPGAETGDLTGWTVASGSWAAITSPNHDSPGTDAPATGNYCFSASNNARNEMHEDGNLSTAATTR